MREIAIVPVNERIIVLPKTQKDEGGIIVSQRYLDKVNEKPEVGFVIAVDTTSDRKPLCKPGDKIVFNKFATTDITHLGVKYLIMIETSVLGIFSTVTDEERKEYLD